MKVRPATSLDTPFLRQLHHRVYREVVIRQFGSWDESAQDGWFEKGLAEAEFSVVEENGEPIGAIGVRDATDRLHLVELQILPEFQGHGFGSALLRTQIEQARRTQRGIALRVLLENRAQSLYARHGFVITGRTDTHYLMEWRPFAQEARMRILVTGASGSGTSTLGRAVALALDAVFVDADDLFWLSTNPPFTVKRDAAERAALLRERLGSTQPVVVSGSIYGWGDDLEDAFNLVVFLQAPADIRVERLRARELQQLGRVDEDFIAWAAQYDVGAMPGRSLPRHLAWLESRTCPVLRLSGTESVYALRSATLANFGYLLGASE